MFGSVLLAALTIVTFYHILVGVVVVVCVWAAIVQRSFEAWPTLGSFIPLFWPYLRAAWMGNTLISASIGVAAGSNMTFFEWIAKNFLTTDSQTQSKDSLTQSKSYRPSLAFFLIFATLCTTSMPVGIFAIRWLNRGSIDTVTEDWIRSTLVAFVGTVVNTSYAYYSQRRRANT